MANENAQGRCRAAADAAQRHPLLRRLPHFPAPPLVLAQRKPDFTKGPIADVYAQLDSFPHWLNNFLAHGYLSTSFFFLLSGFILAYLYWAPNGELSTTPRRFWWKRFTRIFPIHVVVLLITICSYCRAIFSIRRAVRCLGGRQLVATATLTQAWFPPLVPIWSWPTWALSAVVFLYLIMPGLMRWLATALAPAARVCSSRCR